MRKFGMCRICFRENALKVVIQVYQVQLVTSLLGRVAECVNRPITEWSSRRSVVSVNDPIADMLTRIRNECMVRHTTVAMPSSKMKSRLRRF